MIAKSTGTTKYSIGFFRVQIIALITNKHDMQYCTFSLLLDKQMKITKKENPYD
jgi:hypothetical protein